MGNLENRQKDYVTGDYEPKQGIGVTEARKSNKEDEK